MKLIIIQLLLYDPYAFTKVINFLAWQDLIFKMIAIISTCIFIGHPSELWNTEQGTIKVIEFINYMLILSHL
jgi:hypothetical protein